MLTTTRASARAIQCLHRRAQTSSLGSLSSQITLLQRWGESGSRLLTSQATRRQQGLGVVDLQETDKGYDALARQQSERAAPRDLPQVCPGCGARSQTVDQESAGYYGPRRVQKALRGTIERDEDDVFQQALKSGALGRDSSISAEPHDSSPASSICDRCHYLLYQSRGNGIIHPSMESIREIIEESPHKHNHIYHVVDAADFPMSLIPNLSHKLALPRMRSRNRRSKTIEYIRGRQAQVSFIITRADLLAPQKEQVDRMLPELREALRDALGRHGENVRLGNIRCVSAQRGWWTPAVKEEIFNRGGAGWMVGKVNVGKSALFEVVFPKGRKKPDVNIKKIRAQEAEVAQDAFTRFEQLSSQAQEDPTADEPAPESFADSPGDLSERLDDHSPIMEEAYQESELQLGDKARSTEAEEQEDSQSEPYDEDEGSILLPPARSETAYPDMPLVSSLPGTTASPIRIPFGNGKGELIDLPGIHRSALDTFVRPEHQKSLVMKSRIKPEQHTIKPGQSILLGGLIRIKPKTEDHVFLAYPFVPLDAHVTSNARAMAIQTGYTEEGEPYTGTVPTISTDGAKGAIASAGTFKLSWDVTRTRAGALTSKVAGKMKAENLPFVVYSADLLIEGVGWVELVCQVRRRRRDAFDAADDEAGRGGEGGPPEVEVLSPQGGFVGIRRPLNCWMIGGPKKMANSRGRGRPRMSISFQRRKEGGARNQLAASEGS